MTNKHRVVVNGVVVINYGIEHSIEFTTGEILPGLGDDIKQPEYSLTTRTYTSLNKVGGWTDRVDLVEFTESSFSALYGLCTDEQYLISVVLAPEYVVSAYYDTVRSNAFFAMNSAHERIRNKLRKPLFLEDGKASSGTFLV